MRAVVIDRFGDIDTMRIGEVPMPDPGPGEVQIRMICASVNPADWKSRAGQHVGFPDFNPSFPHVIGFDGAGIVAGLGPGANRFKPGDRVLAYSQQRLGRWGSYAELMNVPEASVAKMADNMSFAEASTVGVAAHTAWQDVFYPDRGNVRAGMSVLVHGGSGAVGIYGVQFARDAGARVAATCSAHNLDFVRSRGAERAIDYRAEDIHTAVQVWSKGGVDVLLDCVGLGTLRDPLGLLRDGGVWVRVATLDPSDYVEPDPAELARRNLRAVLVHRTRKTEGELEKIVALMAAGRVRAPRIEILPLESVHEAHRRLQEGRVSGKLVLRIAEE